MKNYVIRFILLGLGITHTCHADPRCEYYKRTAKDLYQAYCQGAQSVRPQSSATTFSDAFNTNPSTLPTDPTPLGIESINNFKRGNLIVKNHQFSVIKGFKKFGAGVSTAAGNTFYSNDLYRRRHGSSKIDSFAPLEPAKTPIPNLNFGTAISIIKRKKKGNPELLLGFSARFNQITKTVGGGLGISYRASNFGLGYGVTREKISNFYDATFFHTAALTGRLFIFELEYLISKSIGGLNLRPQQIISLTSNIGPLILTAAFRWARYDREGDVHQQHYAIQIYPMTKFSIGFLHNYISGASSIAGQLYF